MATKSGVAHLEDVKAGVTLFFVFSLPSGSGRRQVCEVERYHVTKVVSEPHFREQRIYFNQANHWSTPPNALMENKWLAPDLGIYPKGKNPGRLNGHKCFLSFRRAEAYRKRQLATPQTARETADTKRMEDLCRYSPTGRITKSEPEWQSL